MNTQAAPSLRMDQLQTAILADVVTRFVNLHESTSRFSLLVKFEGQPAWQAISNLAGRNMIRNVAVNKTTEDEEYLPTASAFEFCGILDLRNKAKTATTVVLHAVKQMFKGESKKTLSFEGKRETAPLRAPPRTTAASQLSCSSIATLKIKLTGKMK